MILLSQFLILSFILAAESFVCHVEMGNETVSVQPYYRYNRRTGGNDYITEQNVTRNSTILCSNLFSVAQINHTLAEEPYEKILIITHSNISTINSMEFYKFKNVSKLHLNQLQIQNVLPGAFTGLTKLRELYLNDNELTQVLNGVYNSLHLLEILNLTNNKIQRIEHAALIGLTSLTQLHLRHNKIPIIEDSVFETLKQLRHADFSENPFSEFPFDRVPHIETLILSNTGLTDMTHDLSNLTVKVIDLSSCQISHVNFSTFPKCEKVNLANNKIDVINNCQILDTVSLNLDNNRIKTIDCVFNAVLKIYLGHNSFEVLNKAIVDEPKSILVLDYGNNRISTIDDDFFHNFTSLTILKLQSNKISKIDTLLFRDLTNLIELDLSHNQIGEFQYGIFDALTNLEVLDISSNKLLDLHQYTFNSLSSLESLRFDNNQISSFDVKDLNRHLPRLLTVSLDRNLWNCKELVKIEQEFNTMEVHIVPGESHHVENFRGIECTNSKVLELPTNISDISFRNLAQDFFKLVDEGVRNKSKQRVVYEDFDNSKFVQYFDKDYRQSNFFKFLDNYKLTTVVRQDNLNTSMSNMEKLIALEKVPEESSNKILIFGIVLLVIMNCLLVLVVYLMVSFMNKFKLNYKQELSSQMELC